MRAPKIIIEINDSGVVEKVYCSTDIANNVEIVVLEDRPGDASRDYIRAARDIENGRVFSCSFKQY